MEFQAVVLCDNDPLELQPLVADGMNTALLPLITKPLLWYPLKALQKANSTSVTIVVREGSSVAQVKSWLAKEDSIPPSEVIVVDSEATTADAVRGCLPCLTESTIVVIRLGVICDLSITALLLSHYINFSAGTVVLSTRKKSPAAQTKTGEAPEGVEYIGLDSESQKMLFYQSSKETIKQIKIPNRLLFKEVDQFQITTNYFDSGLYIFTKEALMLFESNPSWTDINSDLIPQLLISSFQDPTISDSSAESQIKKRSKKGISVVFPEDKEYLSRILTAANYSEVCKELLSVNLRTDLCGLPPSKQESLILPTATLTGKPTISGSSLIMDGCYIEDKVSIKRSFIGKNCRIGTGSKIINSVLLDNVVIRDQCQIQNSMVANGASIHRNCQIKDFIIGPGCDIPKRTVLEEESICHMGQSSVQCGGSISARSVKTHTGARTARISRRHHHHHHSTKSHPHLHQSARFLD